jgi:hypothetical protein
MTIQSNYSNQVNAPNGASEVGSPNDANQIANNTMEAFGLMAYIAMLLNASNPPANVKTLIANAEAQLKTLSGSVDPNSKCAADINNAIAALNAGTYLTLWNTPSGSQTSILADAFSWMSSTNYNSATNGASPEVGFYESMLFLAIPMTPGASSTDEANLDALLSASGNGPGADILLMNFVLNYTSQIPGMTPADLAAILPASPSNDNGAYKNFLAEITSIAPSWTANSNAIDQNWNAWAACLPPNN